jgi:hypothetical protein
MINENLDTWFHGILQKPTLVEFECITYGPSGMQIRVRENCDERRILIFSFSDLPTAVRIANESQRLVSLRKLPKDHQHSFYLVNNSQFLSWLNAESLDIYKDDPLFHLAIVTDEWIDLICNEPPTITIENMRGS